MKYEPDEKDWMAYLYGELDEHKRERIDQYLESHPGGRAKLEGFQELRRALSSVEDKEIIAPPVFIDGGKRRFLWNAPHFRMVLTIAASLLVIILAGKVTDTRISVSGDEFRLTFGETESLPAQAAKTDPRGLTADQVQGMINTSLALNNRQVESTLVASQEKLDASIRKNLAENSGRIDGLMREVVAASRDQVRQYVSSMQAQNTQLVKDYFQLSSEEQKTYVEDILVDFTRYLQEQRSNDLQMVQTQINSLKQNTDVFRQETEQILTSIISTVGPGQPAAETRN